MLIRGQWLLGADGVTRPVIAGEIQAANGSWLKAPFLVDTAADRTVFTAAVLQDLGLQPVSSLDQLRGVGGTAASVVVLTAIRLLREDGMEIVFRGQCAAVTELETLDLSVLGRDITNLFALIVDRPGDTVCLLGQRHRYTIEHS